MSYNFWSWLKGNNGNETMDVPDLERTGVGLDTAVTQKDLGDIFIAINDGRRMAGSHFEWFQAKHRLSNRLIAHNMFAIVRLEIATSIDQITNDTLFEKRTVTGSGSAKMACNIATSVAIMAGNVFSGGGMTVLGGIIVGGATVVQGLVESDGGKLLKGGGTVAGSGLENRDLQEDGSVGQSFDPRVDGNSTTPNKSKIIDENGEVLTGTIKSVFVGDDADQKPKKSYRVIKNEMIWGAIKYGAGGANAITRDVQDMVCKAYEVMCQDLMIELTAYAATSDGIVRGKIMTLLDGAYDALPGEVHYNGLHPLTKYVLFDGLERLHSSTDPTILIDELTGHYGRLPADGHKFGGLSDGGAEKLRKAKLAVLKSYSTSRDKYTS